MCVSKQAPRRRGRPAKTAEDYQKLAESRGFRWEGELPADTYKRTLWVCCANPEHVRRDSYDNFARKVKRCLVCIGKRPRRAEDYRRLAESRGFRWEGELPASTEKRTRWICSANPEHVRTDNYSNFTRKVECCLVCAGKRKKTGCEPNKTADDYRKLAESRGFLWNEEKLPQNVLKRTRWVCRVNSKHVRTDSYHDFARLVKRCLVCARRGRGLPRKTGEDYRKLAESRGFFWNEEELPQNTGKRTRWICRANPEHVRTDSYTSFSQRVKHCRVCASKLG